MKMLKVIYFLLLCNYVAITKPASMANSGDPLNVAIANEYVANANILTFMNYMLDFTGKMAKPKQQIVDEQKEFFKKISTAITDLLTTVETTDYTTYIKARDEGRKKHQTIQELTSNFTNAYSTNQSVADLANKQWEALVTAFSSLWNYEMLVKTVGEGSEIKLREKLIPIARIIAKLLK